MKEISRILRLTKETLTLEERNQGIKMILGIVVATFMDFFSVVSLLPILYLLLEGNGTILGASLFGGIALILILTRYALGKSIIVRITRYRVNIYERLAKTLFVDYFTRGLLFVKKQGISRIVYSINSLCYVFSQSLLGSIIRMLGDSLLITLLGVTGFIISPKASLCLLVPLLLFSSILIRIVGKKTKYYGDKELEARRKQGSIVMETFLGYSELKVAGAFGYYFNKFGTCSDEIKLSRIKLEINNGIIFPICEGAIAISLIILAFSNDPDDAKFIIGMFAISAFRIMPAVRSLLSCWITIVNSSGCLDYLKPNERQDEYTSNDEYINDMDNGNTEIIRIKKHLQLQDVEFSYPDNMGNKILDKFNLLVNKGDFVCIRGESGIGKTTIFNIIMGLISPQKGTLRVDECVITMDNREEWLRNIGYVSQEVYLFNESIAFNVAIGEENPDMDRIECILRKVALDDWLESQTNGLNTIISEQGRDMSGGQRQRLGLARALYRDIGLLLLDEATSSLDPATEESVLSTIVNIKNENPDLTIIMISHRQSSISRCNRIIEMV